MERKEWDVEPFIGLEVRVRLVDHTTHGHINFDDLKGDIRCAWPSFILISFLF